MSKELIKKEKNEVANTGLDMLQSMAGQGLEYEADELALPFIKIVSALDPILDDEKIGARKGDIVNSVTNAVYKGKDGITVIPCGYKRHWIEWEPRGKGSGSPINIFESFNSVPATKRSESDNKDYLPNGNYVEETHSHFCLLVQEDGTFEQVLISMKSTQLKKSRKWNSMIASRTIIGSNGVPFRSPIFGFSYTLKTQEEKNAKGSWHGWSFAVDKQVECMSTLQAAHAFHQSVQANAVIVKHEDSESSSSPKPTPTPNQVVLEEDDVPF